MKHILLYTCNLFFVLLSCLQICNCIDCSKLPAGLQRMIRGVDITTLDLFPMDLAQSNGFQRSLFYLTCDRSRKWTHPFDDSLVFDIPDQIETISTLPGGVLNTNTDIYETVDDFKKSMQVDVGLGINTIVYGAFSASSSYGRALQSLTNTTKSLTRVSAYVSATQIDMNPYWQLKPDEYFTEYVDKYLPDKYTDNPSKYDEFVHIFGTHYFDSGFFGGLVLATIEMSSRLNLKITEQDIRANAEASYLALIKLNGGYNGNTRTVSQQFSSNTETSVSYYGGKSNLMRPGGWAEWWDSVPRDPWLFGGNLRPISDLVNGTKKAQIDEAVRLKLDRAYLQELRTSLQLVSRYANASIGKQLDLIDALEHQTTPAHSEVLTVGKSVDTLVALEKANVDKSYLSDLQTRIESLTNYELFCKLEVSKKCSNEFVREVENSISAANTIYQKLETLKSETIPNRQAFKELSRNAEQLIAIEKSKQLAECSEKVICNLCRIVVIDVELRSKCFTNDIKHLLNVPLF